MKRESFIFYALFLLIGYGCTHEKPEKYGFIHATYSVGGRLKNPEEIRQSDFRQIQFVYLMAAPKLEMADFAKEKQYILDKYVNHHSYPSGNQGNALVPSLIRKVHEDGSKILISFPGTDFNRIVPIPEERRKFAAMMVQFAQKYKYDGVEVDWEQTVTPELHLLLMQDIRKELDALSGKDGRTYYLTTALNSGHSYTPALADSLSRYVDWINLMMYDMGGGIWGEVATHNTPLANIQEIVENRWGVFDPQKLCIGLASYGFYYQGVLPGLRVTGNLKDYGRYFDYNELPPLLKAGWTEEYDSVQNVPYYFSPDKKEFVTIDNLKSLEKKMDWIKKRNYKGIFWWEFHSDFQPATDGKTKGTHHFMDFATEYISKQMKTTGKLVAH